MPSAWASPMGGWRGVWRLDGKGAQEKVRHLRKKHRRAPVYKRVDTCAAEFESYTPYLYSTYEDEDEAAPTDKKKVIILGSGPNRIGQGIEFDYCCCHAAFALRDDGYETDHDQLQSGDGLDRLRHQRPALLRTADAGRRACHLRARSFGRSAGRRDRAVRRTDAAEPGAAAESAGVPIIGTSPESIDLAEDRKRFGKLLEELRNSAASGRDGDYRWKKRSRAPSASDIRCWCGRPMCSADAPW